LGAPSASAAPVGPAATTACGFHCTDIHFLQPGRHELLKVHSGLTVTNTTFALNQGSNSSAAEDLSPTLQGTVGALYCDPTTGSPYPGSIFTPNQCHALIGNGYATDETFQLAQNPNNGGPETMGLGDWNSTLNPPSGWKARLEPLGNNASTVQILATHLPGGHTTKPGAVWIINGGSSNFSNPLVLTVQNTLAWQAPTWSTVVFNGGGGIDTQEAVGQPGPF
jgi:hypothetical protein